MSAEAATGDAPTRDAAVPGPLRGRVLGPEHADEARRAWERISDLRGGLPAMRDWAWTAAWLRHYGDAVPSSFVLVEDAAGNQTTAYGPVTKTLRRTADGTPLPERDQTMLELLLHLGFVPGEGVDDVPAIHGKGAERLTAR